jgi:hypothetical protein
MVHQSSRASAKSLCRDGYPQDVKESLVPPELRRRRIDSSLTLSMTTPQDRIVITDLILQYP